MQIEIHTLQSFPPANLNRDENGMPKSTVFGGRPRARISSQCQKRAIRLYYQQNSELDPSHFAQRSRAWLPELRSRLIELEITEEDASVAAKLALQEGLKLQWTDKNPDESKTIVFLGKTEIDAIADILVKNWSAIAPGLSGKEPKLPNKDPNIAKVIEKVLVGSNKPGDIALFGRMMAALPSTNVDASVQMAHAISVNVLQQEFDFFTAVDDLGASDDSGADHIGETGYNSSTYYRFTTIDTEQLQQNLGTSDHMAQIVRVYSEAFIHAIPSGHQNAFAAHSKPALIMVVVRKDQPVSLVDAFEDPVRPRNAKSLLENAVGALDHHWADLSKMYGDHAVYKGVVTRSQLAKGLDTLKSVEVNSMENLLNEAIAHAFPGVA
jgi:CRISPR system Cascade subunit CasC